MHCAAVPPTLGDLSQFPGTVLQIPEHLAKIVPEGPSCIPTVVLSDKKNRWNGGIRIAKFGYIQILLVEQWNKEPIA
jgi:hypothetical protein